MNIEKDIHPSIIAAMNGQQYETETTEVTTDDGDTLEVERFTFGDKEPTLVDAIKVIIDLSENTELCGDFFIEAEEALNYVAQRLDINNNQALMLALVINNFADQRIDMNDFGRHLRCTPIALLPYLKEMDVLEERGFVVCNHSGDRPTYRIPYYILEALNDNKVPEQRQLSGLSCEELINELDKIFDQRSDHELTYEGLRLRVKSLLNSNLELRFVEQVMSYEISDDEIIALLFMCSQCVLFSDNHILMHQLSQFYERRREWSMLHQQLKNEKSKLQLLGLIEHAHDGGFNDSNAFCLTMKAKRALFTELDVKLDDEDRPQRGMMRHSDITAHQLFYDEATSRQVNELTGLLSEDNYQKIRQRLQDIMQVNVSEIKSKWVGDSEKNIKALFDDYRKKVKDCKLTPILLFNEADAIINRRQEMAERGVDKMENSIQNIILQEMEMLDGILIATTNLEQNMDKAFERRFLYKIKFNKPTIEARQHIWQSMIPTLSTDAASQLAALYDFSGGQIENIARHHAIDCILHGDDADDLQSLITHCDQERLEKKVRRVGF